MRTRRACLARVPPAAVRKSSAFAASETTNAVSRFAAPASALRSAAPSCREPAPQDRSAPGLHDPRDDRVRDRPQIGRHLDVHGDPALEPSRGRREELSGRLLPVAEETDAVPAVPPSGRPPRSAAAPRGRAGRPLGTSSPIPGASSRGRRSTGSWSEARLHRASSPPRWAPARTEPRPPRGPSGSAASWLARSRKRAGSPCVSSTSTGQIDGKLAAIGRALQRDLDPLQGRVHDRRGVVIGQIDEEGHLRLGQIRRASKLRR